MADLTEMFGKLSRGESGIADELLPQVYQELRSLARQRLAHEQPGQTLQPTALVHEAYLRLLSPTGRGITWENRAHFFAAAAEAMRRILIDRARARATEKRGCGKRRERLEKADLDADRLSSAAPLDLLALDDALKRLEVEDAPGAELVKLLYYTGLSLGEAGNVMGISKASAHRRWMFLRAWLRDAMEGFPDEN